MSRKYEYRVRPVIRYVVTRHHSYEEPVGSGRWSGGCETMGEFANEFQAELAKEAYEKAFPEVLPFAESKPC